MHEYSVLYRYGIQAVTSYNTFELQPGLHPNWGVGVLTCLNVVNVLSLARMNGIN